MIMANRENMEKWAQALESGEYAQARGVLGLVSADGRKAYCCLGVACEAARADGAEIDVRIARRAGDEPARLFFNDTHDVLPEAVTRWLGIEDADPMLTQAATEDRSPVTWAATIWNDGDLADFTQIAKMIRHTYLS